jgi:hypothetical protein
MIADYGHGGRGRAGAIDRVPDFEELSLHGGRACLPGLVYESVELHRPAQRNLHIPHAGKERVIVATGAVCRCEWQRSARQRSQSDEPEDDHQNRSAASHLASSKGSIQPEDLRFASSDFRLGKAAAHNTRFAPGFAQIASHIPASVMTAVRVCMAGEHTTNPVEIISRKVVKCAAILLSALRTTRRVSVDGNLLKARKLFDLRAGVLQVGEEHIQRRGDIHEINAMHCVGEIGGDSMSDAEAPEEVTVEERRNNLRIGTTRLRSWRWARIHQ